jgi:uncharacterized protein (TIRG00374 family)
MSVRKKSTAFIARNILLIGAIIAFAVVLYTNREQLSETWELLRNVSIGTLILLPVVQLVSYFFISSYYRTFLESMGAKISIWRAYGTTAALNFVNQVLPSGGASGTTYLVYAFKDQATPGELTLVQLGRYVMASFTYVPLLITAYIWLLVTGDLNQQLGIMLIILSIVSLPGTTLLILGLKNQARVDRVVAAILRFVNRVVKVVSRGKKGPIKVSQETGFLKEFHDGVSFIRSQGKTVIMPFIFMQLSTLAEVTIVNLAFAAIGVSINPAVVLIAFTAANIAGIISVIPGDVGVHELAIITVLSYVGIMRETAIAATLLYRVFNKIIVMSIGFVCYVTFLKPLVENAQPDT